MAVDLAHWKMIVAAGVRGRALSAGYPDLLVKWNDMPDDSDWFRKVRPDSTAVAKHHSFIGPICDSAHAFNGIGLELEVIDRRKIQGCERIVDLNEPHDLGEYDLVIDPGTSEHCFNIPQALANLAGAVKVGGVMSQALPASMFNHGYWNVNPVALVDFYETNGFEIERMVMRHESGIFEPKPEQRRMRLLGVPDGAVNIITARRLEKIPFAWPQQKP